MKNQIQQLLDDGQSVWLDNLHRGMLRGVQRADVHVVEPALAAQEHLKQRPVGPHRRRGRLDWRVADRHGAMPALGGERLFRHAASFGVFGPAACLAA